MHRSVSEAIHLLVDRSGLQDIQYSYEETWICQGAITTFQGCIEAATSEANHASIGWQNILYYSYDIIGSCSWHSQAFQLCDITFAIVDREVSPWQHCWTDIHWQKEHWMNWLASIVGVVRHSVFLWRDPDSMPGSNHYFPRCIEAYLKQIIYWLTKHSVFLLWDWKL